MSEEFELKLSLAPEQAEALPQCPVLRSLSRRGPRRIVSAYFDTADRALAKAGMALRIRRIGRRRLQTLKVPIAGPVGVQSYREFEAPNPKGGPDVMLIADAALRDRIASLIGRQRLAPMFLTDFKRCEWTVRSPGSEVEVALDVGEIRARGRREAISEAELERKSGDVERLYELALQIADTVPFALTHASKSARGYRLADARPPTPIKATAVALSPVMSARAAFSAIARQCLDHLIANEACAARGNDPEGVHQARVALRRLRALVAAYRAMLAAAVHAHVAGELEWLQQQFGPARDWDVFIAETLEPMQARRRDDAALAALLALSRTARDEAYETVRQALAGDRYARLMLRLGLHLARGDWFAADGPAIAGLDGPVAAFAAPILGKHYRKLRKLGGKRADLGEADLHRLRILAKKLRYLADFLRDIYPGKATKRFIAALAAMQDRLGSLNDAVIGGQLLGAIAGPAADTLGAADAGQAAALVAGWQEAVIDRDLADFQAVWKEFRRRRPFWSDPA